MFLMIFRKLEAASAEADRLDKGWYIMRRAVSVLAMTATIGASVASMPGAARADNGRIAAGVIGGLAVGTLFGAAVAPRPYYAPAPVYAEPEPVYVGPRCY